MQYIHDTANIQLNNSSVVTLGKFDGVHMGHQKLVSRVKEKAVAYAAGGVACHSVVFTFDRIPVKLLASAGQGSILTNLERRKIFEKLGIDILIEYPFTDDFMNMEAEAFVADVLVGQLHVRCIVVGPDFTFGRNGLGTAETLQSLASQYGYELIVVEKERYEGQDISSTYVRGELSVGHMETVNMLLGRPFEINGVVARGRQLGRKLLMPTINLYPSCLKMLPPNGVYASITTIDGTDYYGVTNIGIKPTVKNDTELSVETYLFDTELEAYCKQAKVCLKHFQRAEMKFESEELLKRQMEADAAFAKELFMLV